MQNTIPTLAALILATVAAVADWRTGEISNWITLPPVAVSPVLYGVFVGSHYALLSAASLFLCAFLPYGLFRQGAMGGGDVKLFAALGAVTGFDLKAGIEIQLIAFAIGMALALGLLAWRGQLVGALASVLRTALIRLRLRARPSSTEPRLLTPIRMGGAILLGTIIVVLPHAGISWPLP